MGFLDFFGGKKCKSQPDEPDKTKQSTESSTMGFLDFFNSIFGGTKCKFQPEELDINVTDDAIIINGNTLSLPCTLDAFAKLFGKPRATEPKTNVLYIWDNLGIICYAKAGSKVIFCLGLKTKPKENWEYHPNSPYIGKISINGESYEKVMYNAQNTDVSRRLELPNFILTASFNDMENGDENGCVGAYIGLEMKMKGL